jgi:VWFA-related protein
LQFAFAQQQKQDETIRLRGELVVLDAQVFHKKTALAVGNLKKEDFALYEDGVKQSISHFGQDKLPLSVVILIDVSGSVWPDLKTFERFRRGALEAMNLLKPEDEVALMQFAAKATLVQAFTRDRGVVVNALARLDGRGQHGTSVDEGILGAANYMRSASNPDSRRAIIALTDDVTIAIINGAYVVPWTHAEGEALRELQESGSVVCALLYDNADARRARAGTTVEQGPVVAGEGVSPNVQSKVSPPVKLGIAKHFADATGGISIKTSQEDIASRLTEMIERLRQRYTIGYSPTNTSRDGRFRKIKLSVTPEVERREGSVAVITRKGYYAK